MYTPIVLLLTCPMSLLSPSNHPSPAHRSAPAADGKEHRQTSARAGLNPSHAAGCLDAALLADMAQQARAGIIQQVKDHLEALRAAIVPAGAGRQAGREPQSSQGAHRASHGWADRCTGRAAGSCSSRTWGWACDACPGNWRQSHACSLPATHACCCRVLLLEHSQATKLPRQQMDAVAAAPALTARAWQPCTQCPGVRATHGSGTSLALALVQ
jgi:hypothetical protein